MRCERQKGVYARLRGLSPAAQGHALSHESRRAGFTLIEVLVALAVVAMALAAIGSLTATTARGSRAIDQRLALVETARLIATALPDRGDLAPGSLSGDLAGYRWRVDVEPLVSALVDPRLPTRWVPHRVAITVQSPAGQLLRIDSVRLLRRSEG